MGAVGTASIVWAGQTGKEDESGNQEFVIVRAVTVDSVLDGPKVAMSAPGVAQIGSSYFVSSAEQEPLALLREKTPTRDQPEKTRLRWIVTERYSTKSDSDSDQQKDENGNPTNNPEEWRDEIDISYYKKNRPVWGAYLRDAIPGLRAADTFGPIQYSDGTLADPTLEYDQDIQLVRITRRRSFYPGLLDWATITTVNNDDFSIDKPLQGLLIHVTKYQALMPPVAGTLVYIPDPTGRPQPFWKLTFEVHIDKIYGWRELVLDRSVHARAKAGDPNGRGGIISPSEVLAARPQLRRQVDGAGIPIAAPMMLNGAGQPNSPDDPPTWLTYTVIPEMPFGGRGL